MMPFICCAYVCCLLMLLYCQIRHLFVYRRCVIVCMHRRFNPDECGVILSDAFNMLCLCLLFIDVIVLSNSMFFMNHGKGLEYTALGYLFGLV